MQSLFWLMSGTKPRICYRGVLVLIILGLFTLNLSFIPSDSDLETIDESTMDFENAAESCSSDSSIPLPMLPAPATTSRSLPRNNQNLSFIEVSSGLPTSGHFNFIKFKDFDNDTIYDVAFSAEKNYNTAFGVFAFKGNANFTWTNTSNGLERQYSWAGIDLADADSDGYMEFYAADESQGAGSNNNSGLKVWEYRSGSWTDSATHVTSPFTTGSSYNVKLDNITGDNKLDLVYLRNGGLRYYQNNGNNPVTWLSRSTGLNISSAFTAVAVEDINKDGLKDIIACDYTGSNGEHIFIQSTTGNLWNWYGNTIYAPGTCLGVAVGDVNSDSHMDILFGSHGSNFGIKCYLGNSGGSGGTSFSWTLANTGLPTNGRYYGLEIVDIDLDGDLDVVAAPYTNNRGVEIYLGNGTDLPGLDLGWTKAANTNISTSGQWATVDCEDINGDGSYDIAASSWGSGVKVWLNNISGDLTPPGAVLDLEITNVTSSSITVNWTAPADNSTNTSSGPVKWYDLRYSQNMINMGTWVGASQCTGLPTPATPGTNQSFNITGLSPGTKYFIALRCQDERPNLSPLSNVVNGTTLGIPDTTIPGKIYDLKTENPTNNSINLTWTAPADNGTDISSGPVTMYQIRYNSTAQITNLTWDSSIIYPAPITPATPGSIEKYNVTGLQAETTYYFAIKARDEILINWGWLSNPATGTTLPDPDLTPPGQISDLIAINATDTTINLTWTATGDDGTSGTTSEYDIRYATASITDLTWPTVAQCTGEPVPQTSGIIEHFSVTNLNPETTYYFGIKAADEIPLWSGLSNIAYNTTLASIDDIAPGEINDLTATQPTSTNVTLRWTAPGDDGYSGTVSGYEIRYNTEQITGALWSISNLCPDFPVPVQLGAKQTYVVTGLLSSTTYYFAVKAYDERPNYSPLSNIANATTLVSKDDIAPAAITDLSASAVSENSVLLTWTAPGDDGNSGTATGYDIRYATIQINDSSWASASLCFDEPPPQPAGNPESFTVTGLFASTKYYFAIKTYDERPNYSGLSNIPSSSTYASDDSTLPGKIMDLQVVETNETTATLTWTAPGDDGDSGNATVYEIFYAGIAVTDSNFGSAIKVYNVPTPKPAGETETYQVTGLEESNTYYFAVRAGDEVPNWAPISNSPYVTTTGSSLPLLKAILSLGKPQLEAGENTDLEITVLNFVTDEPVADVLVELSSDNLALVLTPTTGNTNQEGKISVSITAPEVTSDTNVTIFANISKLGFKPLKSQVTIIIEPKVIANNKFNLQITAERLTFSKDNITDGDTITIYANITNLGPNYAPEFNVRFFMDNQQLGDDNPMDGLQVDKYLIFERSWTATSGNHTLRVEAIPMNLNLESDILDNIVEFDFLVREKAVDKDEDDGPGEKAEQKDDFTWVWIIVCIIIIVLVILFFLIRKRKHKASKAMDNRKLPSTEQPEHEHPREQEHVLEPQESSDEKEIPAELEIETEKEPSEETKESTDLFEDTTSIETETQPKTEQVVADTEPPEQLEEIESSNEPDFTLVEENKMMEEDLITQESPGSIIELGPPEQPKQPPEEPIQSQTELQQVPCPVCQQMIVIYSDPCPHCGTDMTWQ